MLYFNESGISWECSGHKGRVLADESVPSLLTPALKPFSPEQPWSPEEHTWYLKVTDPEGKTQWSNIVALYSRLQLSYPDKDKLLALSGIAKRVCKTRSEKYIAGMICSGNDNLLTQLLWRGHFSASRSAKWRAPSWSWASLDGSITLSDKSYDLSPLATIIDVDVKLSDPRNPYGALVAASLRLRCRPFAVERNSVVGPDGQYLFYSSLYRIDVPKLVTEPSDHSMVWVPDDTSEAGTTGSRFFLVLTELGKGANERYHFGGLLLEALSDELTIVRRLGMVFTEINSLSARAAQEFLSSLDEVPETILELV